MKSVRKPGRPPRSEPVFPEEEVDALMVYGEQTVHADTGAPCQRYPSMREIAARFGVSHTTISNYAKRRNCFQRRDELKERVRAKADQFIADTRAEAIAVTNEGFVDVLSEVFASFVETLRAKKIRFDSVRDMTEIVRLFQLLTARVQGEGAAALGGLSLETLQAKHREVLAERSTPETRGELLTATGPPPASFEDGAREHAGPR